MGLGKTIQVIALLTYLVETKGDHGPFMVIAPLSTITNWALEFQRWAPSLNVVVYKGSAQVRKDLFKTRMQKTSFNVLIIQVCFRKGAKAYVPLPTSPFCSPFRSTFASSHLWSSKPLSPHSHTLCSSFSTRWSCRLPTCEC